MQPRANRIVNPKRSLWSAVLIGIGVMAAVDEIIFHQLLQWHHFFDWSTPAFGILSDGLLHAAELILLVAGIFMVADMGRDGTLAPQWAGAGFFLGAGGFQVFDGVVDHKILRIHQVRYGVENLFMYDLLWNLFGLALIGIGVWLYSRAKASGTRAGPAAGV